MTEKSNTEVKEESKPNLNLGLEFDFGNGVNSDEIKFPEETPSKEDKIEESIESSTVTADKKEKTSDNVNDVDINALFEKETKDPGLADKNLQESTETGTVEKEKVTKPIKNISGSTVAFGQYLQEQGSFNFDEKKYNKIVKEKGEAGAFLELMEDQAKQKEIAHIKTLDDYSKEYIEFRKAGYSKEEASSFVSDRQSVDSIKDTDLDENEDLSINIIKTVSRLRGISDDEINDTIDLLKDTDKLTDRAKTNLNVLKEYHKNVDAQRIKEAQLRKEQEKEANTKYFESLRQEINKTDEYIKGKKINQNTKNQMYDLIATPIKTEDGGVTNAIWAERNKDPRAFDRKLAYMMVSGVFNGDVKDITTSARTKILNDLERKLSGEGQFSSGAPNYGKQENLVSKLEEMDIFRNNKE